MTRAQTIRSARVGLLLALVALLAALVGVPGFRQAGAAPGPQTTPSLAPAAVASASSQFTLTVPGNAHCDGTTADNWRAHTFIVDGDLDLSTLDFSGDVETGVPGGWIGIDFDASDGSIAAPLFIASDPRVNMPPLNTPPGLIDPALLDGFSFDPEIGWTLVDGAYQIGFVCQSPQGPDETAVSGDEGLPVQWWALTVTIDADASSGSFLVVDETATTVTTSTSTTTTGGGGSTTTSAPGGSSTTTLAGGSTTTVSGGSSTTTVVGGSTTSTLGTGESTTTTSFGTTTGGSGGSSLPTTGRGLGLVVVGVGLLCLGRIAVLEARARATRR